MEVNLILNDAPPATISCLDKINSNEFYYNCTKCSSQIEILSIYEDNNTIEFKCLNKEHPKETITLKDYFEKMEKYKIKEPIYNTCEMHKNKKYSSFCIECNAHLCDECLKTRINHKKNNIIEIKPIQEELNIIEEIIKYYQTKIDNLKFEKEKKTNELSKNLNDNKTKEKRIKEKKIKKYEKDKEEELKINESEYLNDVNEIRKKNEELIIKRKKKYIKSKNDIYNKYKLINEKEIINYNYKIGLLNKKYNDEINNLKFDEQIENNNYLKKINEAVFNTYNLHNNNYFNAININNIVLSYVKKEHIHNNILQKRLKNNYKETMEIIGQKIREDNINKVKTEEEKKEIEKIKQFFEEHINEIKKNNENDITRIKENYEKDILNNRQIYESEINKYKNLENEINKMREENDNIKNNYENEKIKIREEYDNMKKNYENEIIKIREEYDTKIDNYKKDITNLEKNYINKINKLEIYYKNIIGKMKEENCNNILKFQEYLNVLENKINYVNNEITIIYRINKNENIIKIFDQKFVEAKKEFCKLLYNGNEFEITENFDVSEINQIQNKLEIKLKITNKIISFNKMFCKCSSLLYLPDISKFNTSNIHKMIDMFYNCTSLLFLSDISKWNTSNVENFSEMFDGCSSLLFLPDISKWNTSKVTDMDRMFKNCSSLVSFPDISNWDIDKLNNKKEMFKGCSESIIIPQKFKS